MAGFLCKTCFASDINKCYCDKPDCNINMTGMSRELQSHIHNFHAYKMSKGELEKQAISFAYGNAHYSNDRITRDHIACHAKGDEQVSDQDKPRTWGDVIRQGDSGRYYLRNADNGRVQFSSIERLSESYGATIDAVRLGVRWMYLGCPPLTNPIPPEAPEPVAKVVRWEPTKKDWQAFVDDFELAGNVNARVAVCLAKSWLDRCQRDFPSTEPSTVDTDRIAAIESRLAALESRAAKPADEPSNPKKTRTVPPAYRDRLEFDPYVTDASPVVKGTFVAVEHVISLIVDGWTWSDILRAHPSLSEDDLRACLGYAVEMAEPKDAVAASQDGGQTEPPTMDCYCWIRTSLGEQLLTVWHSRVRYATDVHDADAKYRPIEIEKYWQVAEPSTKPTTLPQA